MIQLIQVHTIESALLQCILSIFKTNNKIFVRISDLDSKKRLNVKKMKKAFIKKSKEISC